MACVRLLSCDGEKITQKRRGMNREAETNEVFYPVQVTTQVLTPISFTTLRIDYLFICFFLSNMF